MPTFGSVLRAYRLGYRISEKRRAFVRLGEVDAETVNVTLIPLEGHTIPNPKHGKKHHWCWWETAANGEDTLDAIPALRNVRGVKKVISFDVNYETGERI